MFRPSEINRGGASLSRKRSDERPRSIVDPTSDLQFSYASCPPSGKGPHCCCGAQLKAASHRLFYGSLRLLDITAYLPVTESDYYAVLPAGASP
ncbi:Hypothetical protein NTJ_14459 [Nesidiocoris tenuis]|uniref:Uncharacterized protein n=1 Tax=Nesidiocoris tenuis TaxID=355587 RepID=A0ABN7BBD6_9HEMI|nr:Hypothetical protein NTJ_14459 [Nesidiocoris tenuis]